MNCLKNFPASATLLSLALLALSGCASTKSAEVPLIVQCPSPGPLPAAILRIDTKPSTGILLKASNWSINSERLLLQETQK